MVTRHGGHYGDDMAVTMVKRHGGDYGEETWR